MDETNFGTPTTRITTNGLQIRSVPRTRLISAGFSHFRKPWLTSTSLSGLCYRKSRTTLPLALCKARAVGKSCLHIPAHSRKRFFGAGLPALLASLAWTVILQTGAQAGPETRITLTPTIAYEPPAHSTVQPVTKTVNEGTTTDLLTFIRALEAPRGYTDYERRIHIRPPRPLTIMTLGEVINWQVRVRRSGAPSTAAGGYQIIYPTLKRLVAVYGISRSQLFDSRLQDRLARLLIAECGPRGPRGTHPRYGNCLAGIWAALPLTQGHGKGRSAHQGVAGNRALTHPDIVLDLLAGIPVPVPVHGRTTGPLVDAREALARIGRSIRPFGLGVHRITMEEINMSLREARRVNSLPRSVRPLLADRARKRDPYAKY